MTINIGVKEEDRKEVIKILSKSLADEQVLYLKTKNFHWNVRGRHFYSLHQFFEDQYTILEKMIDELAERIRQIGGRTPGTFEEILGMTRLKEEPGVPTDKGMIERLLKDHEAVIKQLREDIDACEEEHEDSGTADFLNESMQKHEKMAWMLRAHVELEK